LRSERPYKNAWSVDRTLGYLEAQRGRHFDPDCVDAFLANLDKVLEIHDDLSISHENLN
jgi:response regulator RpfG family c-di-GMP phosphodiesterase